MTDLNTLPLVSIIIPVYNGEKFIDELYNYIFKQDYPNIEIIFVDNNSDDRSVELINNLQNNDSRVKIYFENKQGAGAARNRGVYRSTGEIITFFDVDDTYPSDKISSLAKIIFSQNNIDMVFGKIIAHYDYGKKYLPDYSTFNEGLNSPPCLASAILNFAVGAGPPTIMCKKDAFNSVGGFENDMLIGEDIAFVFKLSLNHSIYFLPKVVAESKRHYNSTMARYKRENPLINIFYDQYKHFYLPYIFKNNLFKVSKNLSIIYLYCIKGLVEQTRKYNYSIIMRMNYLYSEIKYLNKYGLSFFYFPLLLFTTYANQFFYKVMIKIISIIQIYDFKINQYLKIKNVRS